MFECTPEMLDTLSNRIDYLEKICQKVEASKKRSSHRRPKPLPSPSPQQPETSQIISNDDSQPAVATTPFERHSGEDVGDNKDTELKKQTAADDGAEKKFSLSSLLGKKTSPLKQQQQQQTLISLDPATLESLKSILNVRNQLKSATLDLMDRVKKAEEGVLTNLK